VWDHNKRIQLHDSVFLNSAQWLYQWQMFTTRSSKYCNSLGTWNFQRPTVARCIFPPFFDCPVDPPQICWPWHHWDINCSNWDKGYRLTRKYCSDVGPLLLRIDIKSRVQQTESRINVPCILETDGVKMWECNERKKNHLFALTTTNYIIFTENGQ